jgi:hypothetical protein
LREGRKEARKKFRNKNTPHHREDYFIQSLGFNYFIEKKRGCVTEREGGGDNFSRPMEYVIGFFYK